MKKLIFLMCLCVTVLSSLCAETEREDILVIHSYHQGLKWTDSVDAGIRSVLNGEEVELHHEYLDTKRNTGEKYFQLLLDFETRKNELSGIEFELIICSDNNALRFVMDHGEILYPGVPVIFCGINNFSPEMIEGRKDITGVLETIDYKGNIELIRKLHPDRKNLLVLIDQSVTGKLIREEMEEIIKDYSHEYSFEIYQDFVFKDVPEKISSLDKNDVILLLSFNRDSEGRFLSYADGIAMIHSHSRVPIYGAWEFFFGNGIIGGSLTTGFLQGSAAGELAKKLLDGSFISDLDIVTQTGSQMMFDYKELEKFDISLSQLPENSIVINKPDSLIRRWAHYILTLSIITLLVLCIAIARLMRQKIKERHLKLMNSELEERVREKTADLTKQNSELQSALQQIKTLQGIIPMCSKCKKIRNDKGYWNQVEQYITDHTDAELTQGLCPDCFDQLYSDAKARKEKRRKG